MSQINEGTRKADMNTMFGYKDTSGVVIPDDARELFEQHLTEGIFKITDGVVSMCAAINDKGRKVDFNPVVDLRTGVYGPIGWGEQRPELTDEALHLLREKAGWPQTLNG